MKIKPVIKIIIITIFLSIPFFARGQFLTTNNAFLVDLLWSANTYTPAGYTGKALPVNGSIITVNAITPTQDPQNIEFSWLVKDSSSRVQGPEKKGIGENSFVFVANRNIPGFVHKIRIEARNITTGQTSISQIEIPLVKPETHLYTNNNGRGDNNIENQLKSNRGKITTIMAKPFYFNISNISNLNFIWSVDDKKIRDEAKPDTLSLDINSKVPLGTKNHIKINIENNKTNQIIKEAASASSNLLVVPK